MRIVFFFILGIFLFSKVNTFSQQCEWVQKIGGSANEISSGIVTDAQGNVFAFGYYKSATININNQASLTNLGGDANTADCFIVKYNASGACKWASSILGAKDEFINGVSLDSSGNLYAVGRFQSQTAYFGSATGVLTNANTNSHAFLVKYNKNGTCVWAEQISGDDTDELLGVSVDKTGSIYVCGKSNSSPLYFNNDVVLADYEANNIFFAKYSSDGTCQWARGLNAGAKDFVSSIKLDQSQNIYLAGYYKSASLQFEIGKTINNNGTNDCFIAKYDSNLVCQWAKNIGGTNDDFINGMDLDANGNIYVSGYFSSDTVKIDNKEIYVNNNPETVDGFLIKYSISGNFEWCKKIGGKKDESVTSVNCDYLGNIYISGFYESDTLNFSESIKLIHSSDNNPHIFFAKYIGNGYCEWAQTIGGNGSDFSILGEAMGFDKSGGVYISGYYTSSILNFNNDESASNYGGYDVFIAKYTAPTTYVANYDLDAFKFSIKPNPANDYIEIILNNNEKISSFDIYNELGSLVYTSNETIFPYKINISQLPQGAYRAAIKTNRGVCSRALSIVK